MKKVLLILLSVTAFIACDTEPLGPGIQGNNPNGNGNGNGNTNNYPLALNGYSLDVNSTVPLFGTIVVNSDFLFNANNRVLTSTVQSTFFGATSTENITFSRNSSNQITGYTSTSSGVITNETTVTYNGNNISQIVYNYVGDDEDDYTYDFVYSGNTITRTQNGSTISTIFTLNASNQLIKKQSFDGTTSIKTEVLDYDGQGNCISSVITGEDATTSTFVFDTNDNPLKEAFSDQYLLSFLNDDYSDEVGAPMAHFASTNNWTGITTPEGSFNFTVAYDSGNRITSRSANYDFGDDVSLAQQETFQFVN